MRIRCTTTIHVFHPDMFTWFQRSQVDHSVAFIKRFTFDAAYCHTVPSLHLGNMTTVDPAMMVQPERSFEASAPSVAQLN